MKMRVASGGIRTHDTLYSGQMPCTLYLIFFNSFKSFHMYTSHKLQVHVYVHTCTCTTVHVHAFTNIYIHVHAQLYEYMYMYTVPLVKHLLIHLDYFLFCQQQLNPIEQTYVNEYE